MPRIAQEPASRFFSNFGAAIDDARVRRLTIWRKVVSFIPEEYRYATGTYDGLQDDLGWDGAGSYEYVMTYRD